MGGIPGLWEPRAANAEFPLWDNFSAMLARFVCFAACAARVSTYDARGEMLKDRAAIDRRVERKEGYRSSCRDLGRRYSGKIAVTGG